MRLILLLAIGTAGYLIYKLYFQKLLSEGKTGKIKIALIVVGLLFLAMAVMGRASPVFGIIGAAMTQVMRLAPLLIKFAPALTKYIGGAAGLGGNSGNASQSKVRTPSLAVTLDHASGKMDGTILTGEMQGRQLSDLSADELRHFYQDCVESDPEAARVLQAYIARERSDFDGGASGNDNSQSQVSSDAVTVREAYDILGLEPGSTKKEVTQAHRSLMAQLHPDKGGSNYLAAKVNEAKKVLLAHITED